MKHLLFILLSVFAWAEEPTERADLGISLLDRQGQPTTVQTMGLGQVGVECRFRAQIPPTYQYQSWAVELNEPTAGQGARISDDGWIPEFVRWSGRFETGRTLELRKRYFYRLVLILADETLVSSPWVSFETATENYQGYVNQGAILDLTLSPEFSLLGTYFKTKSFTYQAPSFSINLDFILGDQHAVGARVMTSTDTWLSTSRSAERMFYSDFAVDYRYRLWGEPVHGKWISGVPAKHNYRMAGADAERGVLPWSFQLGVSLFSSQWRGAGGLPVDAELPRAYSGPGVLFQVDRLTESWRFVGTAEIGYSAIKGKLLRFSGEAAVFYDGFRRVSPGFQAHYQFLSGKPADDGADAGNDGLTAITAHAISAGLVLHVRI